MSGQGDRWLTSGILFKDRKDAGAVLASLLGPHHDANALVLGLPRGGVLVAAEVARHLVAELDLLVVRRLRAPRAPELTLGAVTANGGLCLNQEILEALSVPPLYLDAMVAAQMAEARWREQRYRGGRPDPIIRDRPVILVDEGLPAGAVMVAAARAIRRLGPSRLVAAAPVGSREACLLLAGEVDEIVCPYVPDPFYTVGAFYEHYESTHDALVGRVLEEFQAGRPGGRGGRPVPARHVPGDHP